MKKNLLLITLFTSSLTLEAQQTQGTIMYETRSSMSLSMNGATQNTPIRVSKNELLFVSSKSLFRNIPSTDEDQKFQNGGMGIGMQVNNDLRLLYADFDKKEKSVTHLLGTKNYIEQGPLQDLNWVISDETKTILGLTCKKAMGRLINKSWLTHVADRTVTVTPKIDTSTVYAWFAASIPLPIGPDKFTGLPGAILQVENSKGRILFEAVSINETVKQKEIQAPSKGKLLSEEAYLEEEKKYKEESTKAMNGL